MDWPQRSVRRRDRDDGVKLLLVMALSAAASAAEPGVPVPTIFTAERSAALKPALDAQVASVAVVEGAHVAKGALILQLDDRQQRARVALAATSSASNAEIGVAQVRAREAEAKLANAERAAKTGAVADWELRAARAGAAQAMQETRMATDRQAVERRRLAVEQSVLDGLRIRAPFDGRVTRLNARAGASVRPADTVAVVTDMRVLRGEAFVPPKLYGLLKVGSSYPVVFGSGFDRRAAAVLTYIDPVMAAGSFRAVFRLDNRDEAIPSGLEGRIILRKPA